MGDAVALIIGAGVPAGAVLSVFLGCYAIPHVQDISDGGVKVKGRRYGGHLATLGSDSSIGGL